MRVTCKWRLPRRTIYAKHAVCTPLPETLLPQQRGLRQQTLKKSGAFAAICYNADMPFAAQEATSPEPFHRLVAPGRTRKPDTVLTMRHKEIRSSSPRNRPRPPKERDKRTLFFAERRRQTRVCRHKSEEGSRIRVCKARPAGTQPHRPKKKCAAARAPVPPHANKASPNRPTAGRNKTTVRPRHLPCNSRRAL